MSKMIVRKIKGVNGNDYILNKDGKKLVIKSFNSYENTSMSVEFSPSPDEDYNFYIDHDDLVYDAFDNFYYDDKYIQSQWEGDSLLGMEIGRYIDGSYVLTFSKENNKIIIYNPNFAWTNLYSNLQSIPSNYHVRKKDNTKTRKR